MQKSLQFDTMQLKFSFNIVQVTCLLPSLNHIRNSVTEKSPSCFENRVAWFEIYNKLYIVCKNLFFRMEKIVNMHINRKETKQPEPQFL